MFKFSGFKLIFFSVSLMNCSYTHSEEFLGMMLSNGCVNCHGYNREASIKSNIPSLAGMDKTTLISRLEGFRSGELKGTVMNRVMMDYDIKKINDLADYFSKLK